jgi:hypothetical protein
MNQIGNGHNLTMEHSSGTHHIHMEWRSPQLPNWKGVARDNKTTCPSLEFSVQQRRQD